MQLRELILHHPQADTVRALPERHRTAVGQVSLEHILWLQNRRPLDGIHHLFQEMPGAAVIEVARQGGTDILQQIPQARLLLEVARRKAHQIQGIAGHRLATAVQYEAQCGQAQIFLVNGLVLVTVQM